MKDIAFYYPGHIWYDTDRIKTMLLFFDGVGFVIPAYKAGEPEANDPVLAGPLRDAGLLHYFVADEYIDAATTELLAKTVGDLIDTGSFNELSADGTAFHSLSMSRMGYGGNPQLADDMFNKLRDLGLARDTEDGSSIPMHRMVRYLVLVLLAQFLRVPAMKKGFDLAPVTDRQKIMKSLVEVLDIQASSALGSVVEFDLQAVSADLSHVPLNEVLDFRSQNIEQHKRYMLGMRKFSREISQLPEHDRDRATTDRQAELDDYASDLKSISRKAWKSPAVIGFSLAGVAWAATGDPMSALLSLGAAMAGASERTEPPVIDAFSYLFSAQERFR